MTPADMAWDRLPAFHSIGALRSCPHRGEPAVLVDRLGELKEAYGVGARPPANRNKLEALDTAI